MQKLQQQFEKERGGSCKKNGQFRLAYIMWLEKKLSATQEAKQTVPNEEELLKKLAARLEEADVRKYTCTNGFGYSQLERDIVDLLYVPVPAPTVSDAEKEKIWEKWAYHKDLCELNYEAGGDCDCGWHEAMKKMCATPQKQETVNEEFVKEPNDTETLEAKLRNSLSPIYSLADTVIMLNENPEIKDLTIELAKTAIEYKERINQLLKAIEKQNTFTKGSQITKKKAYEKLEEMFLKYEEGNYRPKDFKNDITELIDKIYATPLNQ